MSFPQFALLPPELQLRIWQLSLPASRVVDLFAVPVSESLQPRFALPASSPSSPSQLLSEAEPSPIVTKWIRTFIERIFTTPQDLACLHICAEARRAVLKRYVKINADTDFKGDMSFQCLSPTLSHAHQAEDSMFCLSTLQGPRPYGLLDPGRDILFLQDPPQMRDRTGGYIISSLDILLRWLDRDVVQSLRRLAIPYYTWRKTKNAGKLRLLMKFLALEELWVSFLGGGAMGRAGGWRAPRRTWSDVVGGSEEVGGLWSHVKEVEEEVRADVEGLKRACEGWCVPRVRVVRHRGVLMEELDG